MIYFWYAFVFLYLISIVSTLFTLREWEDFVDDEIQIPSWILVIICFIPLYNSYLASIIIKGWIKNTVVIVWGNYCMWKIKRRKPNSKDTVQVTISMGQTDGQSHEPLYKWYQSKRRKKK